ncbi:unnamed protein product [Acanthosepion pharaonis]|uniref:Uncharacterized protein n=1 Tax=Acanthosepion pharaonis TaxID=158019 RepID=A0A812CQZ4_ACAPH|nr:unnamed protein product [Sepia pharaonis]
MSFSVFSFFFLSSSFRRRRNGNLENDFFFSLQDETEVSALSSLFLSIFLLIFSFFFTPVSFHSFFLILTLSFSFCQHVFIKFFVFTQDYCFFSLSFDFSIFTDFHSLISLTFYFSFTISFFISFLILFISVSFFLFIFSFICSFLLVFPEELFLLFILACLLLFYFFNSERQLLQNKLHLFFFEFIPKEILI